MNYVQDTMNTLFIELNDIAQRTLMAILSLTQVHQMTGWSRNTIYAYTRKGLITEQTDASGRKGYDQADALRVFPPKVRTVRTLKYEQSNTVQKSVQRVSERDLLLAEKDYRIADLKELVQAKDLTIADLRHRLEYKPDLHNQAHVSETPAVTDAVPRPNPVGYWVAGGLGFAVLVLIYAAFIGGVWYWNGGIVIK
jgi:DNA-binding transcriptional MerR regulator